MSYRRRHLSYGRDPSLSRWMRVVYLWIGLLLGASWVSWLGFRTFADAVRGDIPYALGALTIGAVFATVTTWFIYRRRSRR